MEAQQTATKERRQPSRAFWLLTLVVAAAVILAAAIVHRHFLQVTQPALLWSIDLGRDPDFHKRNVLDEVLQDPPTLDFLNQSLLICSFYGGSWTDPGKYSALNGYNVLEISPRDGAFGHKLAFNAFERKNLTFPLTDGGFAVLAGDKLSKFNDRFEPVPSLPTAGVQNGKNYATVEEQRQFRGILEAGSLHFTRSSQSPRIAFVTGHYLSRGFFYKTKSYSITGNIIVLDSKSNKTISQIDWNEAITSSSAGLNQMALALSPDGEYLAVILHHTLNFYRLPEP
jgi:hypothetical protein